jgi:hypothetical protein
MVDARCEESARCLRRMTADSFSVELRPDIECAVLRNNQADQPDGYDVRDSYVIIAPGGMADPNTPADHTPTTPAQWAEVERLAALGQIKPRTAAAYEWEDMAAWPCALAVVVPTDPGALTPSYADGEWIDDADGVPQWREYGPDFHAPW